VAVTATGCKRLRIEPRAMAQASALDEADLVVDDRKLERAVERALAISRHSDAPTVGDRKAASRFMAVAGEGRARPP